MDANGLALSLAPGSRAAAPACHSLRLARGGAAPDPDEVNALMQGSAPTGVVSRVEAWVYQHGLDLSLPLAKSTIRTVQAYARADFETTRRAIEQLRQEKGITVSLPSAAPMATDEHGPTRMDTEEHRSDTEETFLDAEVVETGAQLDLSTCQPSSPSDQAGDQVASDQPRPPAPDPKRLAVDVATALLQWSRCDELHRGEALLEASRLLRRVLR